MSFLEQEAQKRLEEIKNKVFQLWDNRDEDKINPNNFLKELVTPYLEELQEDGHIYQFMMKSPEPNNVCVWDTTASYTLVPFVSGSAPTWSSPSYGNIINTNGPSTSEWTITSVGTSIAEDPLTRVPIAVVSTSSALIYNDDSSSGGTWSGTLNTNNSSIYNGYIGGTNFTSPNKYEIVVRLNDSYHVCVISFKIENGFIYFMPDKIQS